MRKFLIISLFLFGCGNSSDNSVNIYYDAPVVPPVEEPVDEPNEEPVDEPNEESTEEPVEQTCVTKLVNFTYPLTTEDTNALNSAKVRCAEIYVDAPCLKKLIKKRHQVYHAICGKNNE